MSTPNPSPSVLVSGASVSGLTLAHWLARYGFQVTVVERAPHLRPGGQALDVRGPALDVAERMGILATLRAHATKLTGFSVVDADGNETHRSEERTLTGGRFDSPDVEVMRDDLCRVMLEAVDARVDYLFSDSIASLDQDATGVDVTFERAAPRRFEIVVGADGLHSRVRALAFGPEAAFIHPLGTSYVAVFGLPNFLGLERWEVMHTDDKTGIGAMIMGLHKERDARAYVGFTADAPIVYDPDIEAQKRLVAARLAGGGWVLPQILTHMMAAPDFHFDSISQVRMDGWSKGRIVLVGDAGYSVALASGQGTSVAMVGAYVLAGELATNKTDPAAGIASYERALRDYVLRNQAIAATQQAKNAEIIAPETSGEAPADALPDFGALTVPFALQHYGDA